jgi:hypothetical protein
MSGEKDLEILLRSMRPKLSESQFVFCNTSPDRLSALNMKPLFVFREKEGVTIITPAFLQLVFSRPSLPSCLKMISV